MAIKLLHSHINSERIEWLDIWKAWPDHEVFAHPSYLSLFLSQGSQALCFCDMNKTGGILFPFIIREINLEPWYRGSENLYDIITPYGYGGVYIWGDYNASEFWSEFSKFAAASNIVSIFARLSLFSAQLLPFEGEESEALSNIVRPLDKNEEIIWAEYEHKVRKNVKRAIRDGIKIQIDSTGEYLSDFLAIYHDTMARRNAANSYYLPESFFKTLICELPGQFVYFHAFKNAAIVSTELVLVSQSNIYSFLGGTLQQAFESRPNDLLKHEIIKWGIRQNKKNYILGGGYENNDGIFKYKQSFSPKGIVPFRVGKKMYDPVKYHALIQMKKEYALKHGIVWEQRPGYFPEYRS